MIAGGCSTAVVCAVIDSEVERYCAVTSSRIDSGVGRCVGAGMVGIAVPIETVAGSDSFSDIVTMVDCQMQCVSTWASLVV